MGTFFRASIELSIARICLKLLARNQLQPPIPHPKSTTSLFCIFRFEYLGIKVKWIGSGLKEHAKIIKFDPNKFPLLKKGMIIVKVSKQYFRPNEVNNLIGNANKAKKLLKWKPKINIYQLIKEMLDTDLENIRKSKLK